MGLLLKAGIEWRLLQAAAMAVLAICLLLLSLSLLPKLRGLISTPTLRLGSAIGNTAYFGIPVALALLPSETLSISIGYDLGTTLLAWSLGPALMAGSFESGQQRTFGDLVKTLFSSPATKGLCGALLVQLTPWSDSIAMFLWVPSRILIVLALLVVGMRLGYLGSSENSNFRSLASKITPSLLIKLLVLPALMLVLCLLFNLPDMTRRALVLQAAAPTAVSLLLMAEASGKDQETATALVVWSTLAAVLIVPLWFILIS